MDNYLSVVVPIYNEEGNIKELVERLQTTLIQENRAFEIILINDGSSDKSWEIIQRLAFTIPELKAIDLAGNFGQTVALRAGFEAAMGNVIIAMDGDLQHSPEDIPRFMKLIDEGYEMVGGYKEERPEGFFKKMMANTAHYIIYKISGINMKYFGATFKAYNSYLLKNTNFLGDATRFMGAVVVRKGIKFIEIPIKINKRVAGSSNYKFINTIFEVILDLIFLKFFLSYMHKPFRIFGVIGILNFLLGTIVLAAILFGAVFFKIEIKADYFAEFLFSIFLILIGFTFISFGVIAEIGVYNYFLKKNSNLYNVRSRLNFQKASQ